MTAPMFVAISGLSLALLSCEPVSYELKATGAKCQIPQPPPKPGPGVPVNATYQSNKSPPLRYRGDKAFKVEFVAPDKVAQACGLTMPICGYTLMACRRGDKLVLPNPCAGNALLEPFGGIVCHELGHANGWPATHGD